MFHYAAACWGLQTTKKAFGDANQHSDTKQANRKQPKPFRNCVQQATMGIPKLTNPWKAILETLSKFGWAYTTTLLKLTKEKKLEQLSCLT